MTFCDSGVTFIQGEKAEGKTNDVVEKSLNNILLKIFNFSNMYYMGGVCTMYTHEMQLHTYKPNNTCRRKLRWLKNVCCGNQRNWTFLGMKFNMYK